MKPNCSWYLCLVYIMPVYMYNCDIVEFLTSSSKNFPSEKLKEKYVYQNSLTLHENNREI